MTLWPEVERDLADVLRLAPSLDRYPAPDGLPPAGTWVRAVQLDDDAVPVPRTPWHAFTGWDGGRGTFTTRCRRLRPGSALRYAVGRYIGDPSPYASPRARLLVELDQPPEGACRNCVDGLARDAERAIEDARQARGDELVELLPVLEAIATDASIDDAERGRRLREAWPG